MLQNLQKCNFFYKKKIGNNSPRSDWRGAREMIFELKKYLEKKIIFNKMSNNI